MRILWLTWKDKEHSTAGGAELVNEEIAKRLVKKGHEIIFLVRGEKNLRQRTRRHGFEVVRVCPSRLFPLASAVHYWRYLRGWADLIIEEINTIPYLSKFYARQPVVLFFHQLSGRVLSYQQPFPLARLGQLAEKIYLRWINDLAVITVSKSTRDDLVRHGFAFSQINLIPQGIKLRPLDTLPPLDEVKAPEPTLLFLGTLRPMKRPEAAIRAFEIARSSLTNLKLQIAGAPGPRRYHQKLLQRMRDSVYSDEITYWGRVSEQQKVELLRRAHLLLVTSVKEGWGLVVSEANSQGTPAVAYNVDGLRDSVRDQQTGLLTPESPRALARAIIRLLEERELYQTLRRNAWKWSRQLSFERTALEFERIITRYV